MTSDNSINIKLPPIAPLFTILGWYWIFLKISWNYIKRSKIEIKFKPDYIDVSDDEDKVMSNFSVPSIIVAPKNNELEIRIKSIRVGSSYYGYLSGGFSVLTGKKHSSKVLSSIEKKELFIKTSKYQPLTIPLPSIGLLYDSYLFEKPKETLLFFPKEKVTVSFEANGKIYYYGLDVIHVCRIIINHLSFSCQGLKTLNQSYKPYVL